MVDPAQRLARALARHHSEQFAPHAQYDAIQITAVTVTSTGAPKTGTGTIGGEGAFPVRLGGNAIGVGDTVWARRTNPGEAAAEYEYVLLLASPNPGGGFLLVDANIPYPLFNGAPGGGLDASGASITAWMQINYLQVEERYRPSGYQISWKPTGTSQWKDEHATHIPGQTAGLFRLTGLVQGSQIDVKLSTEVNWAQRTSPPGPTQTFTAAADTVSPATLTSIGVSVQTPGQLVIKPVYSALDPVYFQDWELSVATSAGGTGAQTFWFRGDSFTYVGSPAANYYVALKARAKNGTYGNRLPSNPTQWQGPYQYAAATPPADATPPPVWAAPIVTLTRNSPPTGGEQAILTVTLPGGYAYPADYKQTIVRGQSSSGFLDLVIPNGGGATPPIVVPFGTWIVNLIGEDLTGNLSGASPSTSVSLSPTGVPAAAPDVTTASGSEAIVVRWTGVLDALRFKVWRWDGAAGLATVIAEVDGYLWVDTFQGNGAVGQIWYYKVQAYNLLGNGTISPNWIAGTVGAVDGRNLVANTVIANKLESNLILSTVIATPHVGFGSVQMDGGSNNAFMAYDAAGGLRMQLRGTDLTFYYAANPGVRKSAVIDGTSLKFHRNAILEPLRAQFASDGMHLYKDDGVTERVKLLDSGLYIEASSGSVDDRAFFFETGGSIVLSNYLQDLSKQLHFYRLDRGPVRYRIQAGGSQNNFTVERLGDTILGITPSTTGMSVDFGSAALLTTDIAMKRVASSQWMIYGAGGPASTMMSIRADAFPQIGFGGSGAGSEDVVLFRSGYQTLDVEPQFRVSRGGGAYAFKITSPSAGSATEFNWSHHSLYMGWNTNPGAAINVGNGAANYGPIFASAFTVSSGKKNKEAIRTWAKRGVVGALRPAQFRRKGHDRDELGFVAESVEEHLPEAVETRMMRHPTPDGKHGPEVEEKFVNPMGLLAALWDEVCALRDRVAELEGAKA